VEELDEEDGHSLELGGSPKQQQQEGDISLLDQGHPNQQTRHTNSGSPNSLQHQFYTVGQAGESQQLAAAAAALRQQLGAAFNFAGAQNLFSQFAAVANSASQRPEDSLLQTNGLAQTSNSSAPSGSHSPPSVNANAILGPTLSGQPNTFSSNSNSSTSSANITITNTSTSSSTNTNTNTNTEPIKTTTSNNNSNQNSTSGIVSTQSGGAAKQQQSASLLAYAQHAPHSASSTLATTTTLTSSHSSTNTSTLASLMVAAAARNHNSLAALGQNFALSNGGSGSSSASASVSAGANEQPAISSKQQQEQFLAALMAAAAANGNNQHTTTNGLTNQATLADQTNNHPMGAPSSRCGALSALGTNAMLIPASNATEALALAQAAQAGGEIKGAFVILLL